MEKLNRIKVLVGLFAIVFASLYLTFLIDVYTLNTWLKRIFIFVYFIIVSSAAFYVYNKYAKQKFTVISIVCAAVVLFFGQNLFLPIESEHVYSVQATELKDENGEKIGYEDVRITSIEVDGKKQNLGKIVLSNHKGWEYDSELDDYLFIPDENNETNAVNILSFRIVGKKMIFYFGSDTLSESVNVFDDKEYGAPVIADGEEAVDVFHVVNAPKTYSVAERILLNIGAGVSIAFAFNVVITLVFRYFVSSKKATESKNSKKSRKTP